MGVAPATLRSWSLRYGIGPMNHSPGRHRRYSGADVGELTAMRELVGQGVVLPTAAAIARHRRLAATAEDRAGSHGRGEPGTAMNDERTGCTEATAADLMTAANRLDLEATTQIIASSLVGYQFACSVRRYLRRRWSMPPEQLGAAAVVVWSQRAATAKPAVLRRLTADAETVVAAGPGWHDVALPPGVTTADSLGVALALTSPTFAASP